MVLIFKLCDSLRRVCVCESVHSVTDRAGYVCANNLCVCVCCLYCLLISDCDCMHKNVDIHVCESHPVVCVVCMWVYSFFFFFFFFRKTIKTLICPEIISDVNVEWCPLEPSNEACGISPAPNLTS